MGYDPYQFAAARSNIAGSAAQGVGQALQQITGAIGEVAQQKIDHKQLVNDYKTKILPSVIKALVDNYDIPPEKAAIIAAKAFPDPSVFGKDDKAAKTHYINQTTKIDDLAQTYLKYQDYKTGKADKAAEKAKVEQTKSAADEAIQGMIGGQPPAGSASVQSPPLNLDTLGQEAPSESPQPFVGPSGSVMAPEELSSRAMSLPVPEQSLTPAGSAALPNREAAVASAAGLPYDTRQAVMGDPVFKELQNKPKPASLKEQLQIERLELQNKLTEAQTARSMAQANGVYDDQDDKVMEFVLDNKDTAEKKVDGISSKIAALEKAKKSRDSGDLTKMMAELQGTDVSQATGIDEAISSLKLELPKYKAALRQAEMDVKQQEKDNLGKFAQALRSGKSASENQKNAEADEILQKFGNNKPAGVAGTPEQARVMVRMAKESGYRAGGKTYSDESIQAAVDKYLGNQGGGVAGSAADTGGAGVMSDDSLWNLMVSKYPALNDAPPEERPGLIQEYKTKISSLRR